MKYIIEEIQRGAFAGAWHCYATDKGILTKSGDWVDRASLANETYFDNAAEIFKLLAKQ